MKCPSCRNSESVDVKLHPAGPSAGASAEIMECRVCGAVWSVSHGSVDLIRDPQANSFLATQSEVVEADDYDASPR
jgi:uncharacterized Zn finger protein